MELTTQISVMGMLCDTWKHESCTAVVGVGDKSAIVYMINSETAEKRYVYELCLKLEKHYKEIGKQFGMSVTLSICLLNSNLSEHGLKLDN